jgi:predicted AlkP superfamily pyrophosphatase or phosphodiesterase
VIRNFLAAILCLSGAVAAAAAAPPPPPKLVVAISIDQLAGGLFDQYRGTFAYGFKRFLDQGVVYPNGYQSHAATETCPGHSTLLSGRHPSGTGIIANSWIDAQTGAAVYCIEDPGVSVPGRPKAPRGPAHLRVSTLGEWLHAANPASRTVSVSGKDRGAIPMAGHNPDAVFWWDDERGFNTYLRPGDTEEQRLAPVAKFNAQLDRQWSKAPPQWKPVDPRCKALDGSHVYGELRIDHRVPPPLVRDTRKPLREDPAFKDWVRASPEIDRITYDLAGELIDSFKLGRGPATDLLTIGFSATDYVGHRFGNQGPEMCDQLAHLDRTLGLLFARLDKLKIPYLAVLTADHGGIDAMERVSERGFPAARIQGNVIPDLNRSLRETLQLDFNPLSGDPQSLYVTRKRTDAALRVRIIAATIAALGKRTDVAQVFTKEQVLAAKPSRDTPADELSLLERYAESVDVERSGDIFVAYKPYIGEGRPRAPGDFVAGHGSPWNYDRRVPILFWRTGAKGFEQYLPVETVDIAPTIAAVLGLPTPELDGRCLDIDITEASPCGIARQ